MNKACIIARGFLASSGIELEYCPSFHDVVVEGGKVKTAMRWTVKKRENEVCSSIRMGA